MQVVLLQLGDQLLPWLVQLYASVLPVVKIIWINILLSGDNAVVIALACRSLPPRQRFWGIFLGAAVAVVLRIVFTVAMQSAFHFPYLKLIGGALLLWIAIKLLIDEAGDSHVKSSSSLWGAVRTVAVADIVMSLDNVLAIAAASKGQTWLIVFGLAVSVPLIVAGATFILSLFNKYPILIWAGAALLGWVAGELMAEEELVHGSLGAIAQALQLSRHGAELLVASVCAGFVILVGWMKLRFV